MERSTLAFPPPSAVDGQAATQPVFFKVGLRVIKCIVRPVDALKAAALREALEGVLEILGVIGLEQKLTAGHEDALEAGEKLVVVHQPISFMPVLGPRIWAKKMEA